MNIRKLLIIILFIPTITEAKWKPEYASNTPEIQAWFKVQHNKQGQWCCDESDGERFDGNYTLNADGSVTLEFKDFKKTLPSYMVLDTPNPTGHAIYWHTSERDYCFSPGPLN